MSENTSQRPEAQLRLLTQMAKQFSSSEGKNMMAMMAASPSGRHQLEQALKEFGQWMPALKACHEELTRAHTAIEKSLKARRWLRA